MRTHKLFVFALFSSLLVLAWSCGVSSETDEENGCSDAADNDSDGDYDCNDSDCAGDPACSGDDDDSAGDDDDTVNPNDLDGDGYEVPEDCDDGNPWINPGAEEVCNNRDDDCNGLVDDGIADNDADSFDQCDDCDDNADTIYPGADEICDGEDSNCDGLLFGDELDIDGDGVLSCDCDEFQAGPNCDCDDNDPAVLPGATENCDPVDDDCDGDLVEGFDDLNNNSIPDCAEVDSDGDGHLWTTDCDDNNAAVFPGAVENCNGVDDDCNGYADNDDFGEVDSDGDGYLSCNDCDDENAAFNPAATETDCTDNNDYNCDGSIGTADNDMDGVQACEGDCNDTDPANYPGNPEVCDQQDNNCDFQIDENEICPPDPAGR